MDPKLNAFLDLQPQRAADEVDQAPPMPHVIAWEVLPADEYARELESLTGWVSWLVDVYSIPPSVAPTCWFLHAGMREELGHLYSAWLFTRHPNAGVGTAGVDFDRHRDAALARLTHMVQVSGCGSSRGHQERASAQRPVTDQQLLDAHLANEHRWRTEAQLMAEVAEQQEEAEAAACAAAVSGAKAALADAEAQAVTQTDDDADFDEDAEPPAATAGRAASKARALSTVASLTKRRDLAVQEARQQLAEAIAVSLAAILGQLPDDEPVDHLAVGAHVGDDPAVAEATRRWQQAVAAALGDGPPVPAGPASRDGSRLRNAGAADLLDQ